MFCNFLGKKFKNFSEMMLSGETNKEIYGPIKPRPIKSRIDENKKNNIRIGKKYFLSPRR